MWYSLGRKKKKGRSITTWMDGIRRMIRKKDWRDRSLATEDNRMNLNGCMKI